MKKRCIGRSGVMEADSDVEMFLNSIDMKYATYKGDVSFSSLSCISEELEKKNMGVITPFKRKTV